MIVAAGRGVRFGSDVPKQFAPLAGRPLALWCVETFLSHPDFAGITVVVPAEYAERPPEWLANLQASGILLRAGGAQRTDSVRLGLATVPAEIELVAVHDGARPLITREAISRVLEQAGARHGAVAGRRVTDSLKEIDGEGRVIRSVDRESLWRAETPQIFPRDLIVEAHRRAESEGVHESDCAALCERFGIEVVAVDIPDPNPKVTRSEDVDLAEAWIARRGREALEGGPAGDAG